MLITSRSVSAVIAALVVAGAGCGNGPQASTAASTAHKRAKWKRRLRDEIALAARRPSKQPVVISSAAPFRWDRFYVLQGSDKRSLEQELGFPWPGPRTVPPDILALALSYHKHVVAWSFFPPRWGEFDCDMQPGGFSRRRARFFIWKDARNELIAIAHRHPIGFARQCLRAWLRPRLNGGPAF